LLVLAASETRPHNNVEIICRDVGTKGTK
jgi:hypothetical protein